MNFLPEKRIGEESSKVDNYYKKEFNYQAFKIFSFTRLCWWNKITADYKDGIPSCSNRLKEGTTKNS
jgi:hypothetical protein